MKYRRIYAIPDIHGRSDLVDLALEMMNGEGYSPTQDLLVFLGDMIDRGHDSKGVIDRVKGLVEAHPENVVALRGNHEQFAIDYYCGKGGKDLWMWNGGMRTEWSYPTNQMTQEHVKFLGLLPTSFEAQGFFFSHAPVPRDKFRVGLGPKFDGSNLGEAGEEYTDWELTWHYFGPECEKKGAMMDVHEGPRSSNGMGMGHLIGICGHIHRGPSVDKVRIFPKYRMLDCGAGCFDDHPLAVHECVTGRTMYAGQPLPTLPPPESTETTRQDYQKDGQ